MALPARLLARLQRERTEEAPPPPAARPARLRYPGVTGVCLAKSPSVFLVGLPGPPWPLSFASFDSFLDTPERMYFFFTSMWTLLDEPYRAPMVALLRDRVARFPQHKFVLLLNDAQEHLVLADLRGIVETHIWNSVCQLDSAVFAPGERLVPKRFDAVLNSRLALYKRNELARQVASLCVITMETKEGDLNLLRATLPHAHLANLKDGALVPLDRAAVAETLASAQTGLILSPIEGKNWATGEYLLSGLPVVTTPSHSGRDRMLTPGNSLFVNDDPRAVAEGVQRMKREAIPGVEIRERALADFTRERRLLFDIMNDTLGADGVGALDAATTPLPHKGSSEARHLDKMFALMGRKAPPLETLRLPSEFA